MTMASSPLTNRILDPSGTALSGVTVNARLIPASGFRSDSPYAELATLESTTTDSSGDWVLNLERNSNITPTGTQWEIEERIPDANGGPKTWRCNITATATVTLLAALVTSPPPLSSTTYITQATGDARYLVNSSTTTFLTQTQAGALYLPITTSFLTQTLADDRFAPKTASYLTITSGGLLYAPITATYLTLTTGDARYAPKTATYLTNTTGDARYPVLSTIAAKGSLYAGTAAGAVQNHTVMANGFALVGQSSATDGLGSQDVRRLIQVKVFDDATANSTGDGKAIFVIPPELTGLALIDADIYVTTSTTATATLPTVQFRNVTVGTDMLSTRATIDANEYTSYTAAAPPVIATVTMSINVTTGDRIAVDVDAVDGFTKGLGTVLKFG